MEQIFIAREEQLKQLGECLAQAVGGQGRVCFVSGEAGSGKTTLVQEFVRRAQEKDKDLAVAVGLCDAQSGIGDAYLPFREVLGQLTGDVDAKLAQGAITKENAGRLRNMLVLAGQAIVDVGPDLVGVFVPGVGLMTKLGAFVAEKVGWLDKLEKLVNKPKTKPGESGIQESHIFEQYANVLCRISEKNPLLIILDDLHWGDAASINLLFHLGRRIGQHRILILGTYRSAEVAIGRGGERHPLEKVLAEFKRYFGDVTIDLDKAVEEEGRQFVEAFLESEPNKLQDAFITNLYHHTGGHPLFTVELLRNMQERGDLIKENEKWVESESLNWENLPTKVEGVIEERIGRLESELKHLLTIGSVQGEDFTAEVVARVQQAEAGGLIRKLSGELERQHRLVHSEGIRRLDPGGQRLSLFRFQHNLFRTYLYNEMSEAERAYLHEDVGSALEALFGDQADEIAVQLALHFEKAGLDEKTRYYLQKAGEQAAARYANEEAIAYFTRALELTPETDFEKRFELLMLRENTSSLMGNRKSQTKDLEMLHNLAQDMNDDLKSIRVALLKSRFANTISDFNLAILDAQRAIKIAEKLHQTDLISEGYFLLGDSHFKLGDYDIARDYLEKALSISRTGLSLQLESKILRCLGAITMDQSDIDSAKKYFEDSLRISLENGDRIGTGNCWFYLGILSNIQGEYLESKKIYEKALTLYRETGNRKSEAVTLANLAILFAERGDLKMAFSYCKEGFLISHEVGNREEECRALGNLGQICLEMGDRNAAVDYYHQALKLSREMSIKRSEGVSLYFLGRFSLQSGDYLEARGFLDESLQIFREQKTVEMEGRLLVEIGCLSGRLGNYQEGLERLRYAEKITQNLNIIDLQATIQDSLGCLLLHLGQYEISNDYCLSAIKMSETSDNKELLSMGYLHLGDVSHKMGSLATAKGSYKQSIKIRQEKGQDHLLSEPQAGLAMIAMQEGNLDEALAYIEQILDFLKDHNLDGTDEPMRIYLTCYQVLQAAGDPRADEILTQAHTILMERANKITDDNMRTSYLENVAANRQIVEAFSQRG